MPGFCDSAALQKALCNHPFNHNSNVYLLKIRLLASFDHKSDLQLLKKSEFWKEIACE